MRPVLAAVALGLAALALGLALAWCVLEPHPRDAQLHNAYWPFSVEVSVRDR